MSKNAKFGIERETFYCACNSYDHQFSLAIDDLDLLINEEELLVTVSLSDRKPFFTRIGLAIKYIFGFRSRYGMFADIQVQLKDKERLISIIDEWGEIRMKCSECLELCKASYYRIGPLEKPIAQFCSSDCKDQWLQKNPHIDSSKLSWQFGTNSEWIPSA